MNYLKHQENSLYLLIFIHLIFSMNFHFTDTANKKVLSTSMSRTVTAIATAKEDAQKTVKTLSPSAVDNDPLADLLK